MMKYEVKQMPDGTVEVLQSDGGEEVLGRLTFRTKSQANRCLDHLMPVADGDAYAYTDHGHPGGKFLCPKQ